MKTNLTKLMLAGTFAFGTAGLASAGSAGLDIVGGSAHSGVDISVTVEESTRWNYHFEFVIANNSSGNGASITGVYIDEGWAAGGLLSSAWSPDLQSGDDVSFSRHKDDPAGIAGWTGSLASFEIIGSDLSDGIDENESVRIGVIRNNSSVTLADMQAALGSSGFNIGLRIQDLFGNDANASAWGLTTDSSVAALQGPPTNGGNDGGEVSGAPTPTAAAAGLALLAIAGYRRRRDA